MKPVNHNWLLVSWQVRDFSKVVEDGFYSFPSPCPTSEVITEKKSQSFNLMTPGSCSSTQFSIHIHPLVQQLTRIIKTHSWMSTRSKIFFFTSIMSAYMQIWDLKISMLYLSHQIPFNSAITLILINLSLD